MASTIYHMDSANLYVGDEDPTNGKFLVIKNVTLQPELEEVTKDHSGGGAAVVIQIGMGIFKVAPLKFKLEGYNDDVDSQFMPLGPRRVKYTVRGNIVDLATHEDIDVKTIVTGRMTKVTKSDFERDKGLESDYEVSEILGMEVFFNGQEKFYFNYFKGMAGVRRNGQPLFAAKARNLGII